MTRRRNSLAKIRRSVIRCFTIQHPIQNQNFVPRPLIVCYTLADTLEDQGRYEGGVQTADAVDDCFGGGDGVEDFGVGRRAHFLAVGVYVPYAGDAGGEGCFGCF